MPGTACTGNKPWNEARYKRATLPRSSSRNTKKPERSPYPGPRPVSCCVLLSLLLISRQGNFCKTRIFTTMNLRSFLRLKDRLLTRERIKFDVSNLKLILCSGNYVKVNGSRSLEVKGHIKGKESVYLGLFRKKSLDRDARGSTS